MSSRDTVLGLIGQQLREFAFSKAELDGTTNEPMNHDLGLDKWKSARVHKVRIPSFSYALLPARDWNCEVSPSELGRTRVKCNG